jgi:hypothetical protein
MSKRSPFRYFRSSPEVIRLAVMMYVRFPLSLRNVEDLLHERGIEVTHETVRYWWQRFAPMFAAEIRAEAAYFGASIALAIRLAHLGGGILLWIVSQVRVSLGGAVSRGQEAPMMAAIARRSPRLRRRRAGGRAGGAL